MTFKKIGFVITLLSFFLAFGFYRAFPCQITSIFFPVNNSLFETVKIVISGVLISQIIQSFILEENHIKTSNIVLSIFLTIMFNILLFILFYMPAWFYFDFHFLLDLIFLIIISIFNQFIFISIFNQFIFYHLILANNLKLDYLALTALIIIYIILGILTYFPFINDVFFDRTSNKFGINTYII